MITTLNDNNDEHQAGEDVSTGSSGKFVELPSLGYARMANREVIPSPNRRDRKLQFGIDCAELVHFTHWEPGGEHIKSLVVKNVVMKTQKIRYKLPQTKYFSMDFPETQTLSAGMSWTIPITFRPVAKECYNDFIEFSTSFGKFNLPVKATLPEHTLEFPATVDFGLCPVRETARKTFLLKNVGELSSYFEWQIARPFGITPRTGTLHPGNSVVVTIELSPRASLWCLCARDASVYTAVSVCKFGDQNQWEKSQVSQGMTVYGIGKYSHLAIEGMSSVFDFGDTFVGKPAELKFMLQNLSAVHANFRIRHAEKDVDPYFAFSVRSGTIQPNRSLEIGITFTPSVAGMVSTDYFDIVTLSGNTIRITCTGRGVGPKVTLNTNLINFEDCEEGTNNLRAMYIQNHTNIPAYYQFLTEQNSIFRIDKISGTINPNTSVALTVRFTPKEPINYYRRVYCLVEHQDGLFVDIIGTCFNSKRRPATFDPKHLENYRERIKNGLWSFGPEQLEEMLKSGTIKCINGILSYTDPGHPFTKPTQTDSPYPDSLVSSEYFYENTGDTMAVSLLDTFVDFGACSRYRLIESQTIRISNNTKGKMSCVWIMPGETTGEEPIFSVSPSIMDIQPRCIAEFRVDFRPIMDNSFYGAQLECFIYFKSMRNFRLVNEDTFTPPWCLTPTISGNTFPPGEESFIPKINFGTTRLDFTPCHVDKSIYRTVGIFNAGDTPVKFAFMDNHPHSMLGIGGGGALISSGADTPFSVKPRTGLLHKNESQLIVFRFSPSEQRLYEQSLKCFFNSSSVNSYDIQTKGIGYYPQISFDSQNTICCKPTCIGAVTKKAFCVRNDSRIHVNFEWRVPKQYSSLVTITPVRGRLSPNSTETLTCTFTPMSVKNWTLKLPCYYYHESPDSETIIKESGPRRTTLTVIGQGTLGRIVSEPKDIDFGAILVNTVVEKEIVLFNRCECDVVYSLEIYRQEAKHEVKESPKRAAPGSPKSTRFSNVHTLDDDWADDPEAETEVVSEDYTTPLVNSVKESELEVLQTHAVLPARSHHTLKLRACLKEQTHQMFTIFYRLTLQSLEEGYLDSNTHLNTSMTINIQNKYHLCNVSATGVHPSVQATDIRCENISKTAMWKLFSIDRFNDILKVVGNDRGTLEADIARGFGGECSFPTDSVPILSPEEIDANTVTFDFGSTPLGSKSTVVHMSLKNSGVVPVEWAFNFPNDLEVEIEHWADPGDYTEEQLHHNLILDNNLFTITPKSGCLQPDESIHVVMTYSHEFSGSHRLPVVFKLKNGSSTTTVFGGKEVLIKFSGYSIPNGKKFIHFHTSQHTFSPVDIGTMDPPAQTYELINRGTIPLNYSIDLSALDWLRAEGCDFPIFECRQSGGTISPNGIEQIEWIFRPLEVREYEVDVPITVADGKTTMITFRGFGEQHLQRGTADTDKEDPKHYVDRIPSVQELAIPEQIAVLSLERINFGYVPLGSVLRQIIVIKNTTMDSELSFKWILNNMQLEQRDRFKITPSSGSLKPNESRVCKVVIVPSKEPRVYNLNIGCEITNETKKAEYTAKYEQYETAVREGREPPFLFRSDTRAGNSTGLSSAQSKGDGITAPGSARSASDIRRTKYKALPPITPPQTGSPGKPASSPNAPNSTAEAGAGQRPSKSSRSSNGPNPSEIPELLRAQSGLSNYADISQYDMPMPPTPFLLYLSIVAESLPVNEFRTRFRDFDTYYHEKMPFYTELSSMQSESDDYLAESDQRDSLDATPECQDICLWALSQGLNDIIQEFEVQNFIEFVHLDPLPFHAQFSNQPCNGIYLPESGAHFKRSKSHHESALSRLTPGGPEVPGYGPTTGIYNRCIVEDAEANVQQDILTSPEFQNVCESILEGTIFNLIQEANVDEFEMTRRYMSVI
ncbi:uncharacterized protein BJ171DRAFT_600142 [Polychytrium aggregatum]|uniref:uncharacterized protein n=1 Tax=Polychytrium aggregatum TaxID=110093 RepID=UPI0022FDCDB7|nr:uncharacterized protein BJ171DRAFT_600142 [Polychytrium aggregatum]KAI9203276.1 hypothetical protein BJ171DRAFT_600142 [Polychytrium aggregatum]